MSLEDSRKIDQITAAAEFSGEPTGKTPPVLVAEAYLEYFPQELAFQKYHLTNPKLSADFANKEKQMKRYSIAALSVILASSTIAIDEMLTTGKFDQREYNERLRNAFGGYNTTKSDIPEPTEEFLDEANLTQLTEEAGNDNTYGSFFSENFHKLPTSLRKSLIKSGFTKYSDQVLSDFVVRTRNIIEASPQA